MRFILTFLFLAVLVPDSYLHATEYTVRIAWEADNVEGVELAGFRLYDELQQHKYYETTDPSNAEIVCTVDVPGSEATFTLVSYSIDGIESDPSDPFTIIFEEASPLNAVIGLTTTEGSLTVGFDATASTGSITKYSWILGDGTVELLSTFNHTFSTPGEYDITLIIEDGKGGESEKTQTITVSQSSTENKPPIASLAFSPGSSKMDSSLTTIAFDAGASSDPEGSELTFYWDFGDGISGAGEALISHQYTVAGIYTASVTVTDSQGLSGSAAKTIEVSADADSGDTAKAVIVASRTSGSAPMVVDFNGIYSTPSEQKGSITQYSWDFGDGSIGSGVNISHIFTVPGSYNVQLKVTDSSGSQAVATKTMVVKSLDQQKVAITLMQVYKLLLLKTDK